MSGIRRSLIFEHLFRPLLRNHGISVHTKKLLDFEIQRLSSVTPCHCAGLLDIPRIYADLGETNIHLEDQGTVPDALWEPPLATVTRRAEALSPADLEYHGENIRAAVTRKPRPEKQPLTKERRYDLAIRCADSILSESDDQPEDFLWHLPMLN